MSKVRKTSGDLYVTRFATSRNCRLPVCVSPVLDTIAWKEDAFQHPGDHLEANVFTLCPSTSSHRPSEGFHQHVDDFDSSSVTTPGVWLAIQSSGNITGTSKSIEYAGTAYSAEPWMSQTFMGGSYPVIH